VPATGPGNGGSPDDDGLAEHADGLLDPDDNFGPDDDGWNDGAGPDRHLPALPYTGLGLWDAHKEAEQW
jgi:hypothetical protein